MICTKLLSILSLGAYLSVTRPNFLVAQVWLTPDPRTMQHPQVLVTANILSAASLCLGSLLRIVVKHVHSPMTSNSLHTMRDQAC